MIDFLLLPRRVGLEADIPLKAEAPPMVEKLYEEKYSGKLVAWIDKELRKCGCVYLNRSTTADLKSLKTVSIYEIKPAKGWGNVGIALKSTEGEVLAVLFSSRHSEQSLEWLKATQKKLAAFLNIKSEYEDHGLDA